MLAPELLEYDLGSGVRAFSTCRKGGYGVGTYATFNINPFYGDDEQTVSRNKTMLCDTLQIKEQNLVIPRQTHGTNVRCIDADFFLKGEQERTHLLENVDALITDLRGVCLSVSTADCVPVFLSDEAHHAIAVVHAGWRGTVAGISIRALQEMNQIYSTDASRLKVVIGPSISLEAFEVGDEVYETFADAGFPMQRIAKRFPSLASSGDGIEKWHIDLWEANRWLLENAGVAIENIQVAGVCTYTQHDQFFSARRLGIKSGRILNGILLL